MLASWFDPLPPEDEGSVTVIDTVATADVVPFVPVIVYVVALSGVLELPDTTPVDVFNVNPAGRAGAIEYVTVPEIPEAVSAALESVVPVFPESSCQFCERYSPMRYTFAKPPTYAKWDEALGEGAIIPVFLVGFAPSKVNVFVETKSDDLNISSFMPYCDEYKTESSADKATYCD